MATCAYFMLIAKYNQDDQKFTEQKYPEFPSNITSFYYEKESGSLLLCLETGLILTGIET